jgi:hypothetical protein
MRLSSLCGLLGVALLSIGCGAASLPDVTSLPDAPVPPGEPRATVQVGLDLEPASSCEEAFELALYASRGVDLIEWQTEPSSCAGRRASIRYLPSRISRGEVLARVKSAALKMEILTP